MVSITSVYLLSLYFSGVTYRNDAYYGYGNGTIWMNYVYCGGSENRLIDCSTGYGFGAYYCEYYEMAGVYCPCK